MEAQPDLTLLLTAADELSMRRFLERLSRTVDHVSVELFVALAGSERAQNVSSEFFDLQSIAWDRRNPPGILVNQIVSRSRGRFFSWWNSETRLEQSCLSRLLDFLDEEADVAIAGPKLRDAEGVIQAVARSRPSPLSLLASPLPGDPMPGWGEYASGETAWFAGPGMVINRLLLEETRGVHPRLDGVLWQLELCRAARRRGWHVHYRNDAQAQGSLGQWLTAMGGPPAPWCRCLDLFRLLIAGARPLVPPLLGRE